MRASVGRSMGKHRSADRVWQNVAVLHRANAFADAHGPGSSAH